MGAGASVGVGTEVAVRAGVGTGVPVGIASSAASATTVAIKSGVGTGVGAVVAVGCSTAGVWLGPEVAVSGGLPEAHEIPVTMGKQRKRTRTRVNMGAPSRYRTQALATDTFIGSVCFWGIGYLAVGTPNPKSKRNQAVELGLVESLSHETVRLHLKKTNWGRGGSSNGASRR